MFLFAIVAAALAAAQPLPHARIAKDSVTVSGISAGCFMAVQMHVSYSLSIKGLGCIAGGPFWCAQDDVGVALTQCMNAADSQLINVPYLAQTMVDTAAAGFIDPVQALGQSKVWLYSGKNDSIVATNVVEKNAELYSWFLHSPQIQIMRIFDHESEHAMVTANYGNPCNFLGSPYINNCNYSAAFEQLNFLYGNLAPGNTSVRSNLFVFDQAVFTGGGGWAAAIGLAEVGYIYIPNACINETACKLHITFHGCLQTMDLIGLDYILYSGYLEVAEANNIVVLFPQAVANGLNPHGCWDWWGFTGPAYASNKGAQTSVVKQIIDAISP